MVDIMGVSTLRCLINRGGRLLVFRFLSDPPRSLLEHPLPFINFQGMMKYIFFSVAK